jgi:hypothetical protein
METFRIRRPVNLGSPITYSLRVARGHARLVRRANRDRCFTCPRPLPRPVLPSMISLLGQKTRPRLPMGFLMTRCAEGDQILRSVITESASRPNVMDLKTLHTPARLATPSISLQDFTAKLAIGFRIKDQAGPFFANSSQSVTWMFSTRSFLSGFGRPLTRRVRESNKASGLPVSKLTPARKSAQIISKQ